MNKNGLEKVLTSNWTAFLDQARVLVEVLRAVRDADLPPMRVKKLPEQKGVYLSASRVEITAHGFLFWIEYRAPQANAIAIGTLELLVSHQGEVVRSETSGHLMQSL